MTKKQTRKIAPQPINHRYYAGSLVYIKLHGQAEPVKILKILPSAKNNNVVLVQSLLTKHRYEIPCSKIL